MNLFSEKASYVTGLHPEDSVIVLRACGAAPPLPKQSSNHPTQEKKRNPGRGALLCITLHLCHERARKVSRARPLFLALFAALTLLYASIAAG